MLEQVDSKWVRGQFINYQDAGRLNPEAETRKYILTNRTSNAMLGTVKWMNAWRCYSFYPINGIFDAKCLREVAEFCEMKTAEHKAGWSKKTKRIVSIIKLKEE